MRYSNAVTKSGKMIRLNQRVRVSRSVFDRHPLVIAYRTLELSDVGAIILGGMSKNEARAVIPFGSLASAPKRTNLT